MNTNFNLTTKSNGFDLSSIKLNDVNNAILAKVDRELQPITAAIMAANQFSTGVSLVMCELLYKLKTNGATAIKASEHKTYGAFVKNVLRVDPSQATNYAKMYERLYYDVDEPYKKLENGGGFNVSQLVQISKLNDRLIRKLFINIPELSPDKSSVNIGKAIKYLSVFDKTTVENVNWNEVGEILINGITKSEQTEKAEKLNEKAEKEAAEKEAAEKEAAENNSNNCNFTSAEEFTKWLKANKNVKIINITVSYE